MVEVNEHVNHAEEHDHHDHATSSTHVDKTEHH